MVNTLPFVTCCRVFVCVVFVLFLFFVFHFTSDHFTSLRLASNHFKYTKEKTFIIHFRFIYEKECKLYQVKDFLFDLKTFALTKAQSFIILLPHYSNSSIKDWPHVHSRHSNYWLRCYHNYAYGIFRHCPDRLRLLHRLQRVRWWWLRWVTHTYSLLWKKTTTTNKNHSATCSTWRSLYRSDNYPPPLTPISAFKCILYPLFDCVWSYFSTTSTSDIACFQSHHVLTSPCCEQT